MGVRNIIIVTAVFLDDTRVHGICTRGASALEITRFFFL